MGFPGDVDNEPTRSRFSDAPDSGGTLAFDLPQIKGPGRSHRWLVHVVSSPPAASLTRLRSGTFLCSPDPSDPHGRSLEEGEGRERRLLAGLEHASC